MASRFTWEALQTVSGNLYSHIRNVTGSVDNVEYYGGATLVNNDRPTSRTEWGLTLGGYINSQNMEADPARDQVFRHEYGHTLQSRLIGPLYLTIVGLPSLVGSGLDDLGLHDHNKEWYEIQANRMSFKYFNRFEPASLDASRDGTPWNDNRFPRQNNFDWYFAIAHPPLLFSWWLLF